ncbi:MAG: hypothetical protein AAGJ46_04725 [Planctomycetota bacterium]
MKKRFRVRLLVDGPLQGALVSRVLLYWVTTVSVMILLAGLQAAWASRASDLPILLGRATLAFGPALIASMVLLPMVLFDALRFSHRFAGPMKRLRNEAAKLAAGESINPIAFRDGDYWADLAREFNLVAHQIQTLRAEAGNADRDKTRADDEATTEIMKPPVNPERDDELCGV